MLSKQVTAFSIVFSGFMGITGGLLNVKTAQAAGFDLAKVNENQNAKFELFDTPDKAKTPQTFELRIKDDKKKTQTSMVAVGPFKAVQGEIFVSDDNTLGNVNKAKDTGRSFGISLRGTYSDGASRQMVVTASSNVFTRPAGKSYRNSDGRAMRVVDSTEQNRASIKIVKFEEDYYVIGGIGAEHLTNDGVFARAMQQAYHEAALGDTRFNFDYTGKNGPTGLSGDASLGIGKELRTKSGSVQAYFIPQVVAQVSTTDRNTQVVASAEAGVKAGPTQVSGYAEKGISLGKDSSLLGLRIDQKLSTGKSGNSSTVFIAVERRKDAMDRWYGNENKKNGFFVWMAGLRKSFGAGARAARTSALQ